MSGHSKWSTIKRQKGAQDKKRGQSFTKLSNAIIIAVKSGGGIGDPTQNFKLRLAIDKARSENMPKDTIERAIEKGMGAIGGAGLQEVVYEGFGPGKIAVLVEAVTDNPNRTTPQVKNTFEKNGGSMGSMGSVAYMFSQKGILAIEKGEKTSDEIFLLAAEAGAQDIEDNGEEVYVYTKPEDLNRVKEKLSQSVPVITAELGRIPNVILTIEDKETAEKILGFMEKLENLDDVQKVYANYDFADSLLS